MISSLEFGPLDRKSYSCYTKYLLAIPLRVVTKRRHVGSSIICGFNSTSKQIFKKMIKSVFAATAALSVSAGAAFAGPYVNVETNAGWTGSEYNGAGTDLHVGYEGAIGESASYYVQGGATVLTPDGGDADTVPSGKAGLGLGLTDNLGAYGEVSFVGLSLIHI